MPLRHEPPAVNINDIAEGLKCVKRDARGQQKRHICAENPGIFEEAQTPDAQNCRTGQPELFGRLCFAFCDAQCRCIGSQRDTRQQRKCLRTAHSVKSEAGGQQQYPAPARRQHPMQGQYDRKKQHKSGCGEIHKRPPIGHIAAAQGINRQSSIVRVDTSSTSAAKTTAAPETMPSAAAHARRRAASASTVVSAARAQTRIMAQSPPLAVVLSVHQ